VRRRAAFTIAAIASGTFAALPGAIASGDSPGSAAAPSSPVDPAPAAGSADDAGGTTPPVPGRPSLRRPGDVVAGQVVALRGGTDPADAGSAVAVQERDASGEWSDVGTVASRSDGAFSVRWRPVRSGRVALRAVFADADGARTADAAPELDLTVLRSARASWFGPGMYGGRTACGQRLDPDTVGVAHRTLPCGTNIRLSYGGRTVIVPVIDRGPFANGASFDLTKATADRLDADGVFGIGYAIIQE
jgi:rare lipoprotein A